MAIWQMNSFTLNIFILTRTALGKLKDNEDTQVVDPEVKPPNVV